MNYKPLIIGCAVSLFIGLVVLVGIGFWFANVIQDPTGVLVTIEKPTGVTVGEEFSMVVVVKNVRPDAPFKLTDIDVADDYLKGLEIIHTDPAHKSSMHVPIDNSQSFSFNMDIPPEETKRFTFRLRAVTPGLHSGDVDVCEGQRFISTLAQTMVENKADGEPPR
jgi:hypothetical protein